MNAIAFIKRAAVKDLTKARVFWALAFGAGGAILTVLVAWAFAFWATPDERGTIEDVPPAVFDRLVRHAKLEDDRPDRFRTMVRQAMGHSVIKAWAHTPAMFDPAILETHAGFPFRCLSTTCSGKDLGYFLTISRKTFVIELPWNQYCEIAADDVAVFYPRVLPLRPNWPAFLANTFCYAVLLWAITRGPRDVIRAVRLSRGRCPRCGYPTGESAVCTECGDQLPQHDRDVRRAA